MAIPLSPENVKNLVLNWYHATNEHLPVAELENLLAHDVRMSYPNTPDPIIGIPAFRKWYAGVLAEYFDETHLVEKWDIQTAGDTAIAVVIVRWETRSWKPGARTSTYAAYLSQQRFEISRDSDEVIKITGKHVLTFEPTAAAYGPFLNFSRSDDPFLSIGLAIQAARNGNLTTLTLWLMSGGNPNQYDPQGWTPLLAACARGHAAIAGLLLDGKRGIPADPTMRFPTSGALPIHLVGQSGSSETAAAILKVRPEHLDSVWDLNGHTLLLQAAFYGHLELAEYALSQGADAAITTARGLSPLDMAKQFQNAPLVAILEPKAVSREESAAYYAHYLGRIGRYIPLKHQQQQAESGQLVAAIVDGLSAVRQNPESAAIWIEKLAGLIKANHGQIDRQGGTLYQPPLVVAVTGNNGDPIQAGLARFRDETVRLLLDAGADPTIIEIHPMGVNAIIRAAVFNHLQALKMMAGAISEERLAAALNEQPAVNGLTALHDTVLRASTASSDRLEGYLEQTRWMIASGARGDIEDFSGTTQRSIAERIPDEARRKLVLDALRPSA